MARKRYEDNDWSYYSYFPRSQPREVKGGIKAQSTGGTFGKSWWAKRWVQVLEGFDIGARLGRGRTYARKGQVLAIDIKRGEVRAKVQGSRPKPYNVTIQVKTIPAADWSKLTEALSRQALFLAKLLAGEMPQDIEAVFKETGLSLFPQKRGDLSTDCSCPDPSNPCKHIAAVYYLLGEEFDRDPFLIFRLRGLEREELLGRLSQTEPSEQSATEPIPEAAPPELLAADAGAFWGATRTDTPDDFGAVEVPEVAAALPKRLGNFPFWRGAGPFLKTLEPIYAEAAPRGLDTFLGPSESAPAKTD